MDQVYKELKQTIERQIHEKVRFQIERDQARQDLAEAIMVIGLLRKVKDNKALEWKADEILQKHLDAKEDEE